MKHFNDSLYTDARKAPRLHLNSYNSYTFETPDDTGTGTNYKGMVLYNLAVLYLMVLPAIAHDSLIPKNISDGAIDGIMKIYAGTDKQVFIAFDKQDSYPKGTRRSKASLCRRWSRRPVWRVVEQRGKQMKRKMSCKKLRKLLIDRDMKRTDLRKDAGISSSSLAKLGKDENVTTDVLLRICDTLDVDLNDIAETVQEEEETLETGTVARRNHGTSHRGASMSRVD